MLDSYVVEISIIESVRTDDEFTIKKANRACNHLSFKKCADKHSFAITKIAQKTIVL